MSLATEQAERRFLLYVVGTILAGLLLGWGIAKLQHLPRPRPQSNFGLSRTP